MVKNSDLFVLNRGHCCSEAFGKEAVWTQKVLIALYGPFLFISEICNHVEIL
jgi:hypothetical protein